MPASPESVDQMVCQSKRIGHGSQCGLTASMLEKKLRYTTYKLPVRGLTQWIKRARRRISAKPRGSGLMCGRADLDCLVEIQTVVEATLMTDKSGAETAPDRRSEALWPILVAVLAAMALTLLRPPEVRVGPFGISSPR